MGRYLVCLLLLGVVAEAKTYPHGWEHSDPPPGDEYLTNRFGRSWMEPFYEGYLIVDDHYVDAPYVVEQRGFVIMVNGERVQDGVDIRLVLPLPPPPAVTNDPGFPTNTLSTTPPLLAKCDPTYVAKGRYWDFIGLSGQKRIDAEIAMLRALPCVSNVIDTGEECRDGHIVWIVGIDGMQFRSGLASGPPGPPHREPDEKLYGMIAGMPDFVASHWNSGAIGLVRNGSLLGNEGSPTEDPATWRRFFEILAGEGTATQRYDRLLASGLFHGMAMHTVQTFFPLQGFRPTTQLWQRLSGDSTWTNDAPARLLALTNGWQRITPAFLRTQEQARVTGPAGRMTPLVEATAREAPLPHKDARVGAGKPATEPAAHPERRFPRGLSIALVVALIVGVWLALRRTKP